jgi:hypothetical protein
MIASDAQWNPVKHRNPVRERSTTCQTGKNTGSNSGLPQEAKGETDPLQMRQSSNHLFSETISQVQGVEQKYCAV